MSEQARKTTFFCVFPSESTSFCRCAFQKRPGKARIKRHCWQSQVISSHTPSLPLSRLPSVHCISSFYPLFTRSISLQYPFIALSSPFRGDKNVSSPTLSGRWVGDEWDMSGRKGLGISFVFPLFSLCFALFCPRKGGQKEVVRQWIFMEMAKERSRNSGYFHEYLFMLASVKSIPSVIAHHGERLSHRRISEV